MPPAGPVRVAHVITDLDVGGAERMLAKLVAGADPARLRHSVISLLPPGKTADEIRAAGVKVASLGMRRGGLPAPGAILRLVRLLRAERPDVVQSWLYHADLMATLTAPLAGRPALAWNLRCSDMDFRLYGRATRWVVRALACLSRVPAAVVVNAEAGRAAHVALGYRPRRWEVIPNGFDTDVFGPNPAARGAIRAALGLAPDAPVIGMLARFDPMKDHATFLAAAETLARARADVHFVLAGRGVTPDNPALAAPEFAGQLHLLGERSDSAALLAAFDLATLTSAFGEGSPNVVGEAMACATPCVATDVGDSRPMIGATGRVVPPRDPAALAAAWGELLALPAAERQALGAAARARIVADYSLAAVRERYLGLYETLRSSRERGNVRAVNRSGQRTQG